MTDDRRAIIVMGVTGCGKSTLGTRLAQEMSCTFLEGDSLHSSDSIVKMRHGTALTDADRWPWLETIARSISDRLVTGNCVVAACSSLKRTYRDLLRSRIGKPLRFVYLDATPAVIKARIGERSDHFMPASLVESQFATLETPRDEPDVLTLSCDDDPDRLVETVAGWMDCA